MLVEKSISPKEESKGTDSNVQALSSAASLAKLHCHQQHARNERLLNLRKIKSRNAARTRRGKENLEFYELAKLLPIPTESSSQLDKASIIRLAMSFLRIREFWVCKEKEWKLSIDGPPPNRSVKDTSSSASLSLQQVAMSELIASQVGSLILQSLDGFMFVLNCDGQLIYISETVSVFLGLSQVEMIGSNIFDYIYPEDRDEFAVHLGLTLSAVTNDEARTKFDIAQENVKSLVVRMRSTLPKKGMAAKSSSFKVVHICTRLQISNFFHSEVKYVACKRDKQDHSRDSVKSINNPVGIVAFGSAFPQEDFFYRPLHQNHFVARVNSSLQFTYCETQVQRLFGYEVREVTGQSVYHCIHASDVKKMKQCHIDLLAKGHLQTPYFRWLHKSGGFKWVCATIMPMPNQRLYPEQSYIWIHTVISDIVEGNQVMDTYQMPLEELEQQRKMDIEKHRKDCTSVCKKARKRCNRDDQLKSTKETLHAETFRQIQTESSQQDDIDPPTPSFKYDENYTGQEAGSSRPKTSVKEKESDALTAHLPEDEHRPVSSSTENAEASTSPEIPAKIKKSTSEESSNVLPDKFCNTEPPDPTNGSAHNGGIRLYCMAKCLKQQPSLHYADFVSEYMDVDSNHWSNPPNREISNHNDLPPGIKQMETLSAPARPTPSVVHHHYPLGIDPGLLHGNPLMTKIVAAQWRGVHGLTNTGAFVVTAPVTMMPSFHVPKLSEDSKALLEISPAEMHTPASVAAILEELKKDPLHKVNPPNKVVLPEFPEDGLRSSPAFAERLLHSVLGPSAGPKSLISDGIKLGDGGSNPLPVAMTSLNLCSQHVLKQHVQGPAVLQVPRTILVPATSMLVNATDASVIAINPGSTLKFPITSASFQGHLNPCIVKPFSFSPVAAVRSVPF